MTSREELIEEAAEAMWNDAYDDEPYEASDLPLRHLYVRRATTAFAVFEKAQAPTDDERNAMARALFIASDERFAEQMAKAWDAPGNGGRRRWYNYADAILAAGFRLPAQTEPTGAEEGLARWLHTRFSDDRIAEWEDLSERSRTAWRDLASDAPTRRPARCTGCHWESRPNGINSHDQFLTHLAKVTAGQEEQS